MKIIIGLGNPGYKYKNTRHNAGFLAVNELAAKNGILIKKKGFKSCYGAGKIGEHDVTLFEPMTYMNLSGEAVREIRAYRDTAVNDVLVISDDIDLPLGQIRLRAKGSAGGHNGLRSIIEEIGSGFARLRIGVGKESGEKIEDVVNYVLEPFASDEKELLAEALKQAAECAEMWIDKGCAEAMNAYNRGAR